MALIEPKEKTLWAQLRRALGRKTDISTFPVTFSTLALLRERVELALAIDKAMHEATKQAHDDNWLAQLAEEADLAMSDEELDPDAPVARSKVQKGKAAAKVNEMKAKLASLLSKPITAKGLSHRYLTANGLAGSAWVDDMVRGGNHEQILGVTNTDAQTDVLARQQHQQPAKKKQKKEEGEATEPVKKAKAAAGAGPKKSTGGAGKAQQKRKPKK